METIGQGSPSCEEVVTIRRRCALMGWPDRGSQTGLGRSAKATASTASTRQWASTAFRPEPKTDEWLLWGSANCDPDDRSGSEAEQLLRVGTRRAALRRQGAIPDVSCASTQGRPGAFTARERSANQKRHQQAGDHHQAAAQPVEHRLDAVEPLSERPRIGGLRLGARAVLGHPHHLV